MDVFLRFQVSLHFFNGKVKGNALEDQKWLRCVWEWQCMIRYIKGKGKGKGKVKLTLEQAPKAQKGSRILALLFL
jgi:hypothetical protein